MKYRIALYILISIGGTDTGEEIVKAVFWNRFIFLDGDEDGKAGYN